jgi:hypothetical protein
MRTIPLTLAQANDLVDRLHRHHKPVRGHRFSLGLDVEGNLVGAAIVGRPVARGVPAYSVAEVTRLVTDGTKNACSALYGACARVAREMGFDAIQTYILDSETGASLRASGWQLDGLTAGGDWNHSKAYAGTRRTDQPQEPKQRWIKRFRSTSHNLTAPTFAAAPADSVAISERESTEVTRSHNIHSQERMASRGG